MKEIYSYWVWRDNIADPVTTYFFRLLILLEVCRPICGGEHIHTFNPSVSQSIKFTICRPASFFLQASHLRRSSFRSSYLHLNHLVILPAFRSSYLHLYHQAITTVAISVLFSRFSWCSPCCPSTSLDLKLHRLRRAPGNRFKKKYNNLSPTPPLTSHEQLGRYGYGYWNEKNTQIWH